MPSAKKRSQPGSKEGGGRKNNTRTNDQAKPSNNGASTSTHHNTTYKRKSENGNLGSVQAQPNLILCFVIGIAISSICLTSWGKEATLFWRRTFRDIRWGMVPKMVDDDNHGEDSSIKVSSRPSETNRRTDTASTGDPIKEKSTSSNTDSGAATTTTTESGSTSHQRKVALKSTWRQHKGTFEVVDKIKHNPKSFTQGLSFFDDTLYESTGNYKESKVIKLQPYTGDELESISMEDNYFGEGMAHYIDKDDGTLKLIQLTYKEQTGFIYDVEDNLQILKTFSYQGMLETGEGWGITHDPVTNTFLVTDGSSLIYIWDDTTLKEVRRMHVTLPQGPGEEPRQISYVNELEMDPFDNYQTVLANIWYNDVIVRINVDTGMIVSVYDFSSLWPYEERPPIRTSEDDKMPSWDCFNGIAATDVPDEYYVTGKWWPYMYRVRLK